MMTRTVAVYIEDILEEAPIKFICPGRDWEVIKTRARLNAAAARQHFLQ